MAPEQMLANLSKLQDDCSGFSVFWRTTLFTFLLISHVKSGKYYLSFGCSTGRRKPSFLVKVICFEKIPYDYRQPFLTFRGKTFNDGQRALIWNRPSSILSFVLSAQDSLENPHLWVKTGKMYLEKSLATQEKSCTRESKYHNPHFGGIKSAQGKVKSAGAQKSLSMHPGIQPEAQPMSGQPVLCRAHLDKGGQRTSRPLPQALNPLMKQF